MSTEKGAAYYQALVDARARVKATISLTPTQAEEVEHGLFIDDTDGAEPWGVIRYSGKRTADLDVFDLNAAIYRVTSSRDIARDGSTDDTCSAKEHRASAALARSLQALTDKLVGAAGGPDNLTPQTRRWL